MAFITLFCLGSEEDVEDQLKKDEVNGRLKLPSQKILNSLVENSSHTVEDEVKVKVST